MVRLAALQGVYYLLTGVWPLLSIGSFQRVTGPKTDLWLVRTVGVLVAAIGSTLLVAAARGRVPPEAGVLATASAVGLGGIDTVYAARGRIARVYLLDAILEGALVAAWLRVAWLRVARLRVARTGGPGAAARQARITACR